MDIKQYKDRVIKHFKACTCGCGDQPEATDEDWELLGQLFLNASENGDDDLNEFDKKILTKKEYKQLYDVDELLRTASDDVWDIKNELPKG